MFKGYFIGGVVEDWTPVLKQIKLASTCLDKVDRMSLKNSSNFQGYKKDKILNVSICSNQFQINKLSRGESPMFYNR